MSHPGSPEVLLLGPLEVRRDGAVLRLGGAKPRALLADLALNLGVALSVDRLVDDLWGEQPPRSAAHAVEVYVSQLRTQLGAALVTRTPGYVLELEEDRLDVMRFTQLAETGRALVPRDPPRAAATLRDALALWRGRALDDFAFEPFAQIAIARLEELRQEVLEERIEADLAAGRHAELVAELEAYVRAEPLRERLRGQLMLGLYRSGRAADALASYRAGRVLLLDELGIEPGPQLRSLESAILRQDESLLVGAPRSPVEIAPAQLTLAAIVAAELELDDALDPETMHRTLSRWHERAGSIVEHHLGTVVSSASESLVAAFGVPAVREDDVLRAARTALELAGADDARVRVGLETGEVAAGSTLVAGEALTQARTAAREAAAGEVVVGRRASALLRHAARFAPKSRRLLDVDEDAPAFERRLDGPLVGRGEELAALSAAFDAAVLHAGCQAMRVVGPAGIGKTRLARELAKALGERAVALEARCAADGAGAGYRALVEVVREAAGGIDAAAIRARSGDDRSATILAAALGAGEGAPSAQEVAWAFRRFCEEIAHTTPLLLVVDDLHVADASLLELVEHLVARARGSMLVVCLFRDELSGERPRFLEHVQRIELDALSGEETSKLVHHLQGHRLLAEPVLDRVLGAAEGNPLFVEQLVAFVAEEGTPVARPLPPTIHALLAARLDRLGPGERAVLARASVVGREFALDDLGALLDADAAATAERHLQKLATTGFVTLQGERYRFRHGLLQEAAYRAVPKAERAELHEQLADHLDRVGEADELVGFHLECACTLHVELGTEERGVRQLAADAGARLAAAGILAWKRNDVPATVGLLERALRWLPAESPLARGI
jgi:DNA-binding SARP family transcriptional activator